MLPLLLEQEKVLIVKDVYKHQSDVTANMGSILFDWLVEVKEEYHLEDESLFLAWSIYRAFLSQKQDIPRRHLQMIGVACFDIACKMSEVYPPGVNDFAYICDHAYTEQEIYETEKEILRQLDFKIFLVTPYNIAASLFKLLPNRPSKMKALTRYFMHLAIVENTTFLLPSTIAAASFWLAFNVLKQVENEEIDVSPANNFIKTHCNKESVFETITLLYFTWNKQSVLSKLQAAFRLFNRARNDHVSCTTKCSWDDIHKLWNQSFAT